MQRRGHVCGATTSVGKVPCYSRTTQVTWWGESCVRDIASNSCRLRVYTAMPFVLFIWTWNDHCSVVKCRVSGCWGVFFFCFFSFEKTFEPFSPICGVRRTFKWQVGRSGQTRFLCMLFTVQQFSLRCCLHSVSLSLSLPLSFITRLNHIVQRLDYLARTLCRALCKFRC